MKPARYIFLNQGLEMSPGKCAAQAAHAETLAMHWFMTNGAFDFGFDFDPSINPEWQKDQQCLYKIWYGDGHYAKYVMRAQDSTQMYTIERYLKDRGFKTYMVVDEGHTEGTYMVPTAMAVELVDKDDERTASIFQVFRSYKPKLIEGLGTDPVGRSTTGSIWKDDPPTEQEALPQATVPTGIFPVPRLIRRLFGFKTSPESEER